MAYHLSSSPSSLFHDPPSISSSSSRKFKLLNFAYSFQPSSSFKPQPKILLHANHVSLHEPIPQLTNDEEEDSNFEDPDGKSSSSSKSYIWVNPRSPRAKQLRKKSYDARNNSLYL